MHGTAFWGLWKISRSGKIWEGKQNSKCYQTSGGFPVFIPLQYLQAWTQSNMKSRMCVGYRQNTSTKKCSISGLRTGKESLYWSDGGFPVGSSVKNLLAMQETQVQSLSQEEALEKETATRSSVLAWRIPRTEEPGVTKSQTWLSHWTTSSTSTGQSREICLYFFPFSPALDPRQSSDCWAVVARHHNAYTLKRRALLPDQRDCGPNSMVANPSSHSRFLSV